MDLKICSLNVRGLGDKLKRREIFNWLRRKNHSIFMLQEVHCSENTMSLWAVEWGYKTLFSCCTSAKGGVAILFNNNFDLQLLRTYLDPNGRFIICDITAEKKCMTIATLYAPNDDDPNFFLNFFDHLNDFQCDEVIIGGDFNLVLDLDMDKKGGLAKTHTESVKILKDFCAQFELLDTWRVLNPDTRRYTWRRKRPEIQCRLDFLLVTESLMCNVKSANISTGYKTDHSLIEIKIALHSNMRGPGFWKLNTSLLTEIDYVNQIRTVIKDTEEEYKNDRSAQTKWIADCTLETQEIIDWKTVYRIPFLCTKITKIIVLQFKLLHRRLATNSFLTKINLKDNEQCTFCQNDKETLIHLFWTCEISTLFWEGFKQWAINRGELSNNTNLSPYLVLGLKPNKNKSINFYFLIARYFIWICKMRSLSPKIENFSLFLSHYDITKTFS